MASSVALEPPAKTDSNDAPATRAQSGVHASSRQVRFSAGWAQAAQASLTVLGWNLEVAEQLGSAGRETWPLAQALYRVRVCRRLCEQLLEGADGRMPEPEPFDIGALARTTMALVQPKLETRARVQLLLHPGAFVSARKASIQGILLSLLLDAFGDCGPVASTNRILLHGRSDGPLFMLELLMIHAPLERPNDAATLAQYEQLIVFDAVLRELQGSLQCERTRSGWVVRLMLPKCQSAGDAGFDQSTPPEPNSDPERGKRPTLRPARSSRR